MLYANGQGVKQDYVQAYKWFDLAAKHGPVGNRATAESNRDIMADKLTAAQIKQAQELVAQWKPAP
jgi:TPR repeat protein